MTREQIEMQRGESGWQNICGKLYRPDCCEKEIKTRIVCFDFGRISDIDVGCRYVIMCEPHWWDKWRIRDWVNRGTPKFYMTWAEARKHL